MVRYLKITRIGETAQRRQFSKIDDRVSLRRLLNLTITAVHPFERMIHCAGPNHVEVDVNQAAMQVFVGLDRRGVITVLPERPVSILALVVFLRRSPGDELHTLRDNISAGVLH